MSDILGYEVSEMDLEEFMSWLEEKIEQLNKFEEELWDAWTEKGYYKQLTTIIGAKETVEFTNTCRVAWKKIVDAITILEHALRTLKEKETEEHHCLKHGYCDPTECPKAKECFEEILEE